MRSTCLVFTLPGATAIHNSLCSDCLEMILRNPWTHSVGVIYKPISLGTRASAAAGHMKPPVTLLQSRESTRSISLKKAEAARNARVALPPTPPADVPAARHMLF
jgi:hypothetical protein